MIARNRVQKLALTAIMSALALAISLMRLEFPFYPLVYLKFDLAEVPSVLTFALAGPWWGYACALVHFGGLLARGSDPLGASMKLGAVTSMLAGLHVARHRWKLAIALAMALRSAAMAAANLAVLGFLFPAWLRAAQMLLAAAGLHAQSAEDALLITLVLTTVFNCLHVILSVIPAIAIAREVERRLKPSASGQ